MTRWNAEKLVEEINQAIAEAGKSEHADLFAKPADFFDRYGRKIVEGAGYTVVSTTAEINDTSSVIVAAETVGFQSLVTIPLHRPRLFKDMDPCSTKEK